MVFDRQQLNTVLIRSLPDLHVESPDPLPGGFREAVLVASHERREYRERSLLNDRAAKLLLSNGPAMTKIADEFLNVDPIAFGDVVRIQRNNHCIGSVSYTHLRAHETGRNLVCRLLLEKKKK